MFATTPWNYGLVLDGTNPAAAIEVVKKPGPLAAQPFTADAAPIELRAKGRRIPAWTQDGNGLVRTLQDGPAFSDEPVETIALIPMGAARLRISSFPVASNGADAKRWTSPPPLPRTSHWSGDNPEALNDGRVPANSHDARTPRYTWWGHKGTAEWAEYAFDRPRKLTAAEVYWYDDTATNGGCRPPMSWQILYKDGEEWKPVKAAGPYAVELDRFNRVTFEPVETTGVRLSVQLQPTWSAGALEWRVE